MEKMKNVFNYFKNNIFSFLKKFKEMKFIFNYLKSLNFYYSFKKLFKV